VQVLSVEDVAGLKYYRLQDEKGQAFIAEPLFYAKKPKSRLTAEIVREIEGIIRKRKNLLEHPAYIRYEGVELINGEYCLLRRGEDLYQPLYVKAREERPVLEEASEWMLTLGELASMAEAAGINWPVISPASLYLSGDKSLKVMDPDISMQLLKYREPEEANLMEIYLAPEVFRDNIRDQQSLLYSAGVIMYYLFTGELPYNTGTVSDYNKSDLVHEILNIAPLEPAYLNPELAPGLNSFIMQLLQKERGERIKNWQDFLQDLRSIKAAGLYASKEEREEFAARAEKVIKKARRKKGYINFWRKKWKPLAIVCSIVLFLYLVSLFTAVDPYVNKDTLPEEVVEYFYLAIDKKNTALLDESSEMDLKYLDRMVASIHVIESMQSAYNFGGEEQKEGVFGIQDLQISKVDDYPTYRAEYRFYFYIEDEEKFYSGEISSGEDYLQRYEVKMTDLLKLEQIKGIWQVVSVEGSLENLIEGKIMELLE
jgi:hypothetical protein